MKFTIILSACLPQPVSSPDCARCMALELLDNNDNHVGFMKLLFQLMLIRCAMVFPFILYYLSFIFKLQTKGDKLA